MQKYQLHNTEKQPLTVRCTNLYSALSVTVHLSLQQMFVFMYLFFGREEEQEFCYHMLKVSFSLVMNGKGMGLQSCLFLIFFAFHGNFLLLSDTKSYFGESWGKPCDIFALQCCHPRPYFYPSLERLLLYKGEIDQQKVYHVDLYFRSIHDGRCKHRKAKQLQLSSKTHKEPKGVAEALLIKRM